MPGTITKYATQMSENTLGYTNSSKKIKDAKASTTGATNIEQIQLWLRKIIKILQSYQPGKYLSCSFRETSHTASITLYGLLIKTTTRKTYTTTSRSTSCYSLLHRVK